MLKTAIIGASGYIGSHLFDAYLQTFPDTIGTFYSRENARLIHLDLTNPYLESLRLSANNVKSVVIASGICDVATCEKDKERTRTVNIRGTLSIIEQLARESIHILFLSSDYVYAGTDGDYNESDLPAPTTEYGRQKVEIEMELPKITSNYTVVRLSKIYGTTKGDGTLLDEMAANLASGSHIKAARDQIFCPTHITDLVRGICAIQSSGIRGTINFNSSERWSRLAIATSLSKEIGVSESLVVPISLHDIPSMENRPLNTSMNTIRKNEVEMSQFKPLAESLKEVAKNWSCNKCE